MGNITTQSFEDTIKTYLDNLAEQDSAFAKSYAKPNKSIKECCTYITQGVRKSLEKGSNCVVVGDAEVYGMAVHYYDEDDIEVKAETPNVKVAQSSTPKTEPKADTPSDDISVEVKADIAETVEAPTKKPRKPRTKKAPKVEVQVESELPDELVIPIF